jgi:hypothetical protein
VGRSRHPEQHKPHNQTVGEQGQKALAAQEKIINAVVQLQSAVKKPLQEKHGFICVWETAQQW